MDIMQCPHGYARTSTIYGNVRLKSVEPLQTFQVQAEIDMISISRVICLYTQCMFICMF